MNESTAKHSVLEDMGGKESIYTKPLLSFLREWKKRRTFCKAKEKPFKIETIGVRTPGRAFYVGLKKCMVINASFSRVYSVSIDFANYQRLFLGFNKVELVSKKDNFWVLVWEKEIPFFIIPNIKYEIAYVTEEVDGNSFRRYQFLRGDRIRFIDGIEILEKYEKNQTLFYNYEFYEADFGLGLLGIDVASPERVWNDSLEGSYRSILAIRLKSENPEWSYELLHKKVDELLKKINFKDTVYIDSAVDFPNLKTLDKK